MKPLIGIICNLTWEKDGVWAGYRRSYVNLDYHKAVEKAGGIPVLIPLTDSAETVAEAVERVDGLIITGGEDVNPLEFGEEPSMDLGRTLYLRDRTDIAAITKALEIKKPLLGICRGHQIINCMLGGTLHQDLKESGLKTLQHVQQGFPDTVIHTIDIQEDSYLKKAFGDNDRVNSYHHQIIDRVGEGLKVTARAKDTAIEAIERIDDEEFIMGVQFHPEMIAERFPYCQEIFNLFVKETERRRK